MVVEKERQEKEREQKHLEGIFTFSKDEALKTQGQKSASYYSSTHTTTSVISEFLVIEI